MENKFEKLLSLNVNDKTEKKNGLTYLSWSWAWAEFCKIYPEATYTVLKNQDNIAAFGNKEQGYMVYTEVTAGGITHEMWLPVMDFKNKSILNPTTFDINKAIMRCLTKNLAMFGLALYVYSGEDLPEQLETPINQVDIDKINELIKTTQTEEKKFLQYFKVEKVEELNSIQADKAIKLLNKKIK